MANADRPPMMIRVLRGLAALLSVVCPLALAQADAPRGADGLLAVPPLARVTDLAGALKAADKAALEQKLAAFESARGAQIAVVVVPSTQPEPIEDYAHRIGEAWKIGRRGIGDGLLIVVATQDRRARIAVARSLDGAVPDAVIVLAAQLRRDAAPSSGKVRHPATAPPSSAATRTHWRLTRYRQVRRRP